MLKVTTETKAVLAAEHGAVIGLIKGHEPGKVSIAVQGQRAVLTPAQMRALAAWLNETAAEQEKVGKTGTLNDWLTREREAQHIRTGLSGSRRW